MRTSTSRVDLPEPETPVMHTNLPQGDIYREVLEVVVAPSDAQVFAVTGRRCSGTGTTKPPREVRTGQALGHLLDLLGRAGRLPARRARPRLRPRSTTQSALRMVSSSCSTTRTVLPKSRKPSTS